MKKLILAALCALSISSYSFGEETPVKFIRVPGGTLVYLSSITNKTEDVVAKELSKASRVFYATSSTSSSTGAKVANTPMYGSNGSDPSFVLSTGVVVLVKFTYSNSAPTPTLNVNGTGARYIHRYDSVSALGTSPYAWQAQEVVGLVYDGTAWQMLKPAEATTSYPGITKLSNTYTSSDQTVAATQKAVFDAYTELNTTINDTVLTEINNVSNYVNEVVGKYRDTGLDVIWTFSMESGDGYFTPAAEIPVE